MVGIPGRISRLDVSDDGGLTYTPLGGIIDATFNVNVDELETTSHDSAGHREYIPNHDDSTMDLSLRWVEEDPGQGIVMAKVFDKSTFLVRFRMQIGSQKREFRASAFATKFSPKAPLDDAAGVDSTLRLSGLISVVQP